MEEKQKQSGQSFIFQPAFWLVLTIVFYLPFEIFHSCSFHSIVLTSLSTILGFWSLVGMLVMLIRERVETKHFSFWWLTLIGVIVVLTLLDWLISKNCVF